jgi:uncharacterized membrane protein
MRIRAIIITCALCTILLLAMPLSKVHAQNYVQYKVEINIDGSASWIITQASDLNGTIDTWKGFQQRIENLVGAATNLTQREMSIDPNSLQMNTIWETQSQTTEYQFTWLNFSTIQDGRITFGDLFRFSDFFSHLYGNGELQISYPSPYSVLSASPQPNGGNTAPQTLDWLGTQFFVKGNPNIVLVASSSSPSPTPNQAANSTGWQLYGLIGAGLAVAIAALTIGFYVVKRRKHKTSELAKTAPRIDPPAIETEEEKIVKVIQANGGSAYQSAITEKCRFSKAKASQLLTALEKKGVVTRYKKGRDKIVTLVEQGKGETP